MEFTSIFVVCLWYFVQLACIAKAPTTADQITLKKFGCASIALVASFGNHFLAHAIFAILGYFLYGTWKEAQHSDLPGEPSATHITGLLSHLLRFLLETLSAAFFPEPEGFSKGFSCPNTHWDDENESDDPDVTIEPAHAHVRQANSGHLLKKVKELSKSNEASIAHIDKMIEQRNELNVEAKRLSGQNFDLRRQLELYEIGAVLQKETDQVIQAKQLLSDLRATTSFEISELKGKLAHSETVIKAYRQRQMEGEEREKKKDEEIESLRRVEQSTEAKLFSLDMIIATLHELSAKGGPMTEATVYVMNELVRSNIPIEHLQIDLGKFAYYVKYVGLQWSKLGRLVGGFRATLAMHLGGDSCKRLVFIHNCGSEESMPILSLKNRQQLEHACNDLEVRYASRNTGYSGPVATAGSSSVRQPAVVGPGSLVPLAGSTSGGLTIKGTAAAPRVQRETNVFFSGKAIPSGGRGTLRQTLRPMKESSASNKAASPAAGVRKRSASPDQGINIEGAASTNENPFVRAAAAMAQKGAQTVAPGSGPFAPAKNPFDRYVGSANTVPQNRGAGSSFSIPIAPPSSFRGLARDTDSVHRL